MDSSTVMGYLKNQIIQISASKLGYDYIMFEAAETRMMWHYTLRLLMACTVIFINFLQLETYHK